MVTGHTKQELVNHARKPPTMQTIESCSCKSARVSADRTCIELVSLLWVIFIRVPCNSKWRRGKYPVNTGFQGGNYIDTLIVRELFTPVLIYGILGEK